MSPNQERVETCPKLKPFNSPVTTLTTNSATEPTNICMPVDSNVDLGINRSKASAAYVTESPNWFGAEQAKRLTQLHVGAIYSPIKNVELGAEYIYGQRKFFGVADGGSGSSDGKLSRFDLMGRYSF